MAEEGFLGERLGRGWLGLTIVQSVESRTKELGLFPVEEEGLA